VHAPGDVPPIARDVDVLQLGSENEGVERKMRLDEAAVSLRLEQLKLSSSEGKRMSSHGESSATRISGSPPKRICPTICCVHVVPDLAYVLLITSSGRNEKRFQIVESMWWFWNSRVLHGQLSCSIIIKSFAGAVHLGDASS
jgi:hypothetical protein